MKVLLTASLIALLIVAAHHLVATHPGMAPAVTPGHPMTFAPAAPNPDFGSSGSGGTRGSADDYVH